MRSSSPSNRAKTAVESFSNASGCIGRCEKDMSLFAITRGQWSMIDAVLHVLNEVGPSKISLWTWTVADYEVQVIGRLMLDKRVTSGRLCIDRAINDKYLNAKNDKNNVIKDWKNIFGPDSVRYLRNHAKIARVESASGLKFLLRGSMNLNFNPRFENFDISEGGPSYDLIESVENELPILGDDCTNDEVVVASKVSSAFTTEQLSLFDNPKTWKPNQNRAAK